MLRACGHHQASFVASLLDKEVILDWNDHAGIL